MDETDERLHICDASVTLAFSVLGKRWNGMIISTLGAEPASFAKLRRAVGGISDTVLSDRLSELAGEGLVSRAVESGPPVTVSYSLTQSARELLPILDQLGMWAAKNISTARP